MELNTRRLKEQPIGTNTLDLAGHRFGRWTAIERVRDKGGLNLKERSARWLVRCDCGVERVHMSRRLTLGETKSCGCLKSESTRERHEMDRAMRALEQEAEAWAA